MNTYDDNFGLEALADQIDELTRAIPQGLDRFKVGANFLEIFEKDFERRGNDPQVIREAFDSLELARDNLVFSRYVRRKLRKMNMEDLYDTQEQFLDKDKKFERSSYDALTGYLTSILSALPKLSAALREASARIEGALAACDARMAEVAERLEASEAKREQMEKEWMDRYGEAFASMARNQGQPAPQAAPTDKQRVEEEAEELEKRAESKRKASKLLLAHAGLADLKVIFPKASDSDLVDYLIFILEAPNVDQIVSVHTRNLLESGLATADQVDAPALATIVSTLATCSGRGYQTVRGRLKKLAGEWRKEHPSK